MPIIPSKIVPAAAGRSVLARPRLIEWFQRHRDARLVLIGAEAGYGKSTLLSEHAVHSHDNVAWYRLETSDQDWITFLNYMVAAVREIVPGFGDKTEALLRHFATVGPTREVVLAQFLAELGRADVGTLDLILDDYHLVEGSDDVSHILGRLLERGPQEMRLIVAGRGRPDLALGRLLAQGRIAELTIDDLRFTREEIEQLFEYTYQQPLTAEASAVVADRTEGWAASLQLVSASIAAGGPANVSSFIEALDGARGPIYDFLAEEVLTRLSAQAEQVLMHASLLSRVSPALAVAAMSPSPSPPSAAGVEKALRQAESLGLLSDRHASSGGRMHPLFRQFLSARLAHKKSVEEIRAIHRAVAVAAEPSSWLVAATHFAKAHEAQDSIRAIAKGAPEALGTGLWAPAVEVLEVLACSVRNPSVDVLRARALVGDGRPDEAAALLAGVSDRELDENERALVGLARASTEQSRGRVGPLWREVRALSTTGHSNPVVRQVATAWSLIGDAVAGGPISHAFSALEVLASDAGKRELSHFQGIALHNAATAALAQAEYYKSRSLAVSARKVLGSTPSGARTWPSSLMVEAIATSELGEIREGLGLADEALSAEGADADVIADAAYLATLRGDTGAAEILERRLQRMIETGPTEVGTPFRLAIARVTRMLAQGRTELAGESARELMDDPPSDLDGLARVAYVAALTALLGSARSAASQIERAVEIVEKQGAWRWDYRLKLMSACANRNEKDIRVWVEECSRSSGLALLELADLLGNHLDLIDPLPSEIEESVARYPGRWRPVLARQVHASAGPTAPVAARLLVEHGSLEDAERLAEYESQSMSGRRYRMSRTLVRRVSPTLRVHDLGRTTYEVAGVEMRSSSPRRKAMALVMYLVTRPRQTAPRDQLMEDLWPGQSPSSATNSLHQTLHFVRRDIAPWGDGRVTADYVPLDAEVVFLDPELVHIDSVAFFRQASEALAGDDIARQGPTILRLYTGRFAPEFEYEDWAEDWRSLVHTQFLRLAHATASAQIREDMLRESIEVLTSAIEVDPYALDLRATLVRCLSRTEATDAAAEHYRRYAALVRSELDERPPSMDELLAE